MLLEIVIESVGNGMMMIESVVCVKWMILLLMVLLLLLLHITIKLIEDPNIFI